MFNTAKECWVMPPAVHIAWSVAKGFGKILSPKFVSFTLVNYADYRLRVAICAGYQEAGSEGWFGIESQDSFPMKFAVPSYASTPLPVYIYARGYTGSETFEALTGSESGGFLVLEGSNFKIATAQSPRQHKVIEGNGELNLVYGKYLEVVDGTTYNLR
jgi:hypothetical protein